MNGRFLVGRFRRCAAVVEASVVALFLSTGCSYSEDAKWHPHDGGGGEGPILPTGGAASCDEDCVPPPDGWSAPALIGLGSFTEVPACPGVAPYPGIEAYADLHAEPVGCPVCQCGPSETACSPPLHWVAAAADCAGASGAEATAFNASQGWDGACAAGGIAAGAQCGGAACVQSLTVEAPFVTAGDCEPEVIGQLYTPPATWGRRARECLPVEPGTCPEEAGQCFPPPGFSLCIHRSGELACPEPYRHREIFHQGMEDTRGCAPCACGAPEGNACTALASAFQDGACGVIAGALLVTSTSGDGCVDIPPGLALAGKTAEVVSTSAGACAPTGGEPHGGVAPTGPLTVCCREELSPR